MNYTNELLNIILYAAFVFVLAAVIVFFSFILGTKHFGRVADEPYESGIKATGSARLRFSGKFYIIAMFFVIFDLESIFFIAWAISFKEAGPAGYAGILVFVLLLFAILIYEWRIGAFKFSVSGKDIIKSKKKIYDKI